MSMLSKAVAARQWELAALCLLIGALKAARKRPQSKLATQGSQYGK